MVLSTASPRNNLMNLIKSDIDWYEAISGMGETILTIGNNVSKPK